VVLISVWPALQAFLITTADEVWRGVLSQFDNAGAWTPAPYLLPFLMGFAWLLAIWALDIRTPWSKRDDTHLFLMAWFLSHFILIYIPLNFQIHLLSGWQVVIGVMATIGLHRRVLPLLGRWFKQVLPARLTLVGTALLLLLVVPTNLYLFGQRFIDLRRANNETSAPANTVGGEAGTYFLTNGQVSAMQYLESQVTSEDVVLASIDMGQFVPALTGARSFLGHWAQTLDFFGKQKMVNDFFQSATTDAERQQILEQYNVDYVIHGAQEKKLGDYDPASAAYLTEVFNQDDVIVFKVNA
jgi:hypothetical protein